MRASTNFLPSEARRPGPMQPVRLIFDFSFLDAGRWGVALWVLPPPALGFVSRGGRREVFLNPAVADSFDQNASAGGVEGERDEPDQREQDTH